MSLPQSSAWIGIAVYIAMLSGLALFIASEVRKWRTLGAFISARQVRYRAGTFVLLGLLMADLGLLFFLPGGAGTLRAHVVLLWVLGGLLVALVVLTVLDFREIQLGHYRREMEFYGEMARALVEGDKKAKSEADSGEPTDPP